MKFAQYPQNERPGLLTAAASLFTAFVAGVACIGPMMGIAMGVSGLGWLTQYHYLTLPASLLSVTLLGLALYLFTRRKTSCINRRKRLLNVVFLAFTVLVVVGINVFEFLILPNFI